MNRWGRSARSWRTHRTGRPRSHPLRVPAGARSPAVQAARGTHPQAARRLAPAADREGGVRARWLALVRALIRQARPARMCFFRPPYRVRLRARRGHRRADVAPGVPGVRAVCAGVPDAADGRALRAAAVTAGPRAEQGQPAHAVRTPAPTAGRRSGPGGQRFGCLGGHRSRLVDHGAQHVEDQGGHARRGAAPVVLIRSLPAGRERQAGPPSPGPDRGSGAPGRCGNGSRGAR